MSYLGYNNRSYRPSSRTLEIRHKGFSERPDRCPKCGSSNIKIKYCSNSGAREHTSLVGTWVGDSGGFVCQTTTNHFHMYCNKCDYWD